MPSLCRKRTLTDAIPHNLHRKRRHNHNEIEKKRRDQQRQRLDVLREQIPLLESERPSAVTIISSAIDYIKLLKNRLALLEGYFASTEFAELPRLLPAQPQFISVPSEPHRMAGETLLSMIQTQGIMATRPRGKKLAPRVERRDSNAAGAAPVKTRQELLEQFPDLAHRSLNAQPAAALPALVPKGAVPMPSRRDSSMLLPTSDPKTFLFGKRNSSQNFFAGQLPSFFEDFLQTEINCTKCFHGVENLVMIDCDKCHSWYHIRCVGIKTTQIPLQWQCPECVTTASSSSSLQANNL